MRIVHTVRRKGGSHHEIGGVVYHFAPADGDERHIATVDDPAHVDRFLSIPTFEPADPVGVSSGIVDDSAAAVVIDELVSISDEELADLYAEMFGKRPHHNKGRDSIVNDLREARRKLAEAAAAEAASGEAEPDAGSGGAQPQEDGGADEGGTLSIESLRELYRDQFGKYPPKTKTAAEISAKLAERE